jgi:hypothetical protein
LSDVPDVVSVLKEKLHARVDGVFLPLSIRQNRIEDVFLDFLAWLVPSGESVHPEVLSSATAVNLIMSRLAERMERFRLSPDPHKRELIGRWIAAELVVHPAQTNRTAGDAVSFLPLHSSIALHVTPAGQSPAYGRFISELLSRQAELFDFHLMEELSTVFGSSSDDFVTDILASALQEEGTSGSEPYRSLEREGTNSHRLVWSVEHARRFQDQIQSLLDYQSVVSRKTFLTWLYAVIAFFLATYFLRMANAAESYADWLEAVTNGSQDQWLASLDDPRFAPAIPYGRRNESHARLLKRLPAYTSEVQLAQVFCDGTGLERGGPGDLAQLGEALREGAANGTVAEVFGALVDQYPTSEARAGKWKLPEADKKHLVILSRHAGLSEFALAARVLNFEDMARRSNNVMEFQFYSSLARHPEYGFARRGRTGDILFYEMSEALTVALAHGHLHQTRDEGTLSSFISFLETLGFTFDGEGHRLLEEQLLGLGLLEDLADAGDAKHLSTLYQRSTRE